jgi:hypothetical protein
MTLHLTEYIRGGEIINSRKNSVHGYLSLLGSDRPLVLQLTGNCSADLAGRHIRFEIPSDSDSDSDASAEEYVDGLQIAWNQIGVPGQMTTEKSPSALYLEWYGQNGHIVIDLQNPGVEFVIEDVVVEDPPRLDEADEIDDDFSDEGQSPSVSFEQATDPEIETWEPAQEESEEDPFGLFSPNLDSTLRESQGTWRPEPDDETLAQWKEWDEVFDGSKDVPLSSLFDPPLQLPPEQSLDDERIFELFNTILKELARHNVAFHMCEHFTPRAGYALLVNQILPEYGTHPELPRIGYTMNLDTSEFCDECAAAFDREFGETTTDLDSLDDNIDPDSISDDDVPF